MFIISQVILKNLNICKHNNVSTYSIATGLVVYASIYLYLLYNNNDFLYLFNKFIIYIIGIDLLLSTFYHISNDKVKENNSDLNSDNTNDSNKIKEHLNISDDETTEDFDDYDENLDDDIDQDEDDHEHLFMEEPIDKNDLIQHIMNLNIQEDKFPIEQDNQIEEQDDNQLDQESVQLDQESVQLNQDNQYVNQINENTILDNLITDQINEENILNTKSYSKKITSTEVKPRKKRGKRANVEQTF